MRPPEAEPLPLAGAVEGFLDAAVVESRAHGSAGVEGGGKIRKAGWIVAARVIAQAAQFLVVLVAARFMSPADFGVFALLSAGAVGLTRVSEAGWREFLITVDDPDLAAQANALALLCGTGALLLGLLASLVLGMAGAGPAAAAIAAVMAPWVLLTTLSAAQAGVLVRRQRLRALAGTQIAGEILGLATAIAVFAAHGGVFGLAVSKLVSQAAVLALSLAATRWFRLARPRGSGSRQAWLFSRRILLVRVIGFAQDNVGVFVIGSVVGAAGAGLFRAAGRLSASLSEVVGEPLRLLAWSTLPGAPPGAADRLLSLAVLVSTPLFVGLAVTADLVVRLLLGENWAPSAPLLSALALAGWINGINIATEPILASRGRVDVLPRLSLATTAIALSCLLATAPFGILLVAVGQAAAAVLALPVILWTQWRFGGVSPRRVARDGGAALPGAAALCVAVWGARAWLPADAALALRLAGEAAAGGIAYLAAVLVLVPRHIRKRTIVAEPS